MFAIGNKELNELKPIGRFSICPKCHKKHIVKYGERVLENGKKEPSKMLGFVNCGKESYLVAVNGKELTLPQAE